MEKDEKMIDDAIQFAIIESEAELVGRVAVDSGNIEIGDGGIAQFSIPTVLGDGEYPVWDLGDYIIIEKNMLKVMESDGD